MELNGETRKRKRLTAGDKLVITQYYLDHQNEGLSYEDIAYKFNISKSSVGELVKGIHQLKRGDQGLKKRKPDAYY
ncbi:unnamed protein product [Blepharisma stoltei]|uniref:Uncharacterized protein n=1 Tax=Blepharisma stoltei TaxID=1481888 RepID=A0AAU9JPG2_9CILI|nr:unnamed protein product [Blepharisma stoltei]